MAARGRRDRRLECSRFFRTVDALELRFVWLPDSDSRVRLARDSELGGNSDALDFFFDENI
jgi:hypothetical protein